MAFDYSPMGSPGRLAVAWLEGLRRGGIMILSIYWWHSEGLNEKNWRILCGACEAIAKFGGPWMIGSDWNLEPCEIL